MKLSEIDRGLTILYGVALVDLSDDLDALGTCEHGRSVSRMSCTLDDFMIVLTTYMLFEQGHLKSMIFSMSVLRIVVLSINACKVGHG